MTRKELKAMGLCCYCHRKAIDGQTRCSNCAEVDREKSRQSRRKLKTEVFLHYGGKCICCDEGNQSFLSIDHVNGGGKEHRNSLGGSSTHIYYWLKRNGYPDAFQLLCHNCNHARFLNGGECPGESSRGHKLKFAPFGLVQDNETLIRVSRN